jgi:hypothetical protein
VLQPGAAGKRQVPLAADENEAMELSREATETSYKTIAEINDSKAPKTKGTSVKKLIKPIKQHCSYFIHKSLNYFR